MIDKLRAMVPERGTRGFAMIACSSFLAVSALSTAGTYALWDSQSNLAGSTITNGNLTLTVAQGQGTLYECNDAGVPSGQVVATAALSALRPAPGNAVVVDRTVTAVTQGDNMRSVITVNWPTTATTSVVKETTLKYTVLDSQGAVAQGHKDVPAGTSVVVDGAPQGTRVLTVRLTFTLDPTASATYSTTQVARTWGSARVQLNQVRSGGGFTA